MDMQIITSETQINIEQHFKVTAGPGAGKTKFLINHIKNVLHNSSRLGRIRKIACITYTNVGVETILKRLGDESDHVIVSTIHSFLFTHIVKPYLHLISEKYKINLMKVESPYEHIVSRGYFSRTDLGRKHIKDSEMKNVFWVITGNSCNLHIKGRKSDFHNSLLKYKMMFWEKGIIHYEDILAFAWEILNYSEEILRVIRSKFPYFFIDEFQDTNPIQTEIIKLISEKETVVGVIGDTAQSIYEFQGADVKQFNNFNLPGIISLKIEDNHRSTIQIIKVLNSIRKDIQQKSPKNISGSLPIIFVGAPLKALKYAHDITGEEVVTLSYSNLMANSIRNNKAYNSKEKWSLIDEVFIDSNSKRRKILVSLIKAIEYSRLFHFKEAIRELSKHLKNSDELDGKKTALEVIKIMLNNYSDYSNKPLWTLYNLSLKHIEFPKIREAKSGETPSEIEMFYKNTSYSNISLRVKIDEDDSMHRTIHKAKGSEFDNVLVIVKGRDDYRYDEDRDLGFLINPNIVGNEGHRVNYVACSRAKKNLFICVPELSDDAKSKLEENWKIEWSK